MLAQLPSFVVDVIRLTVWLFLLAIIFLPLERLFAERPQKLLRRQIGVDLGYYFLNGLLTAAALAALGGFLAAAARHAVPGSLLNFSAHLPLWLRIVATLVVGELGFYWGHRLSHEIPFLWRFHAIHHSAEQVDWLTNTRAHPVDLVFTRLCGFVLLYLTGLAQPTGGAAGLTAPLLVVFATLWGFFIHANVRWRLGWLEWIVATPAFHRWHHTNDANRDHNYAAMLPVFDWLFATLHLPRKQVPPSYGIDTPISSNLAGQLFDPIAGREPARPLQLQR